MAIFYRWLINKEDVQYTKSNHTPTSVMLSAEQLEELESSVIRRQDYAEFGLTDVRVIPIDVFDSLSSDDNDELQEVDVIPELDGVCCFSSIDAAANFGVSPDDSNYMMIFEGEFLDFVHDGEVASVNKVLEVVSASVFFDKVAASASTTSPTSG